MGETNTNAANTLNGVADAVANGPGWWEGYGTVLIWACVIGAIFGILWYKGQIARFVNYVRLTREELRKCSWPTWIELRGSTVVIFIAIALLGGFTVIVDYIFAQVLLLLS